MFFFSRELHENSIAIFSLRNLRNLFRYFSRNCYRAWYSIINSHMNELRNFFKVKIQCRKFLQKFLHYQFQGFRQEFLQGFLEAFILRFLQEIHQFPPRITQIKSPWMFLRNSFKNIAYEFLQMFLWKYLKKLVEDFFAVQGVCHGISTGFSRFFFFSEIRRQISPGILFENPTKISLKGFCR